MHRTHKPLLFIVAALSALLVACNLLTGLLTQSEGVLDTAPTEPAAGPVTVVADATPAVSETSQPSLPPAGWVEARLPDAGLRLFHPPGWSLTATPLNEEGLQYGGIAFAANIQFRNGDYLLHVGYRPAGSEANLIGTGMPAGQFEPLGQTPFLGRSITKQVIVFEGLPKVVVYGPATINGVDYAGRLDSVAVIDYLLVDIPADIQVDADQILASFEALP